MTAGFARPGQVLESHSTFTDQSSGLGVGLNAGWEKKLNMVSLSLLLNIMPCSRRVPGDGH